MLSVKDSSKLNLTVFLFSKKTHKAVFTQNSEKKKLNRIHLIRAKSGLCTDTV